MFSHKKARYWVVIPAAGIGKRMKAKTPKQYLALYDGRTVLEHTVSKFQAIKEIAGICVCLAAEDTTWLNLPNMEGVYSTRGGKERADSVLSGLRFLDKYADKHDWVLVHDAARPAIDLADIQKLMKTVDPKAAGGILGHPVRDTLKQRIAHDLHVAHTVDRTGMWQAQTPQMFRLGDLRHALDAWIAAKEPITDEAQAMEKMGHLVQLVEGNPNNIKLTQAEDLALINWLCQQQAEK